MLAGSGLPNDLFVLQSDGVTHRFDGRKLSTLSAPGAPTVAYDAWVAPAPSGDLFVAGNSSRVYRYSIASGTWSSRPSPAATTLFAIGGVLANEVYVGTGDAIYHMDSTNFTRLNATSFPNGVQAIWMRDSTDGWAVGHGSLIVRIMGGTATVVNSTGSVALHGIHGVPAPSQHIWVVGSAGFISRYDGSSWTAFSSGTTVDLFGVVARSETDVWSSGNGGTLLYWDGTAISAVPSRTTANVRKLWGNDNTGLWLAGDNAFLMRYQP